jgi:hypothetical protein
MKLSEAILLGSTVVTPKAGALRFSGENAGCALGMAAIASGSEFLPGIGAAVCWSSARSGGRLARELRRSIWWYARRLSP